MEVKKNKLYIGYEFAIVHLLVELICFHELAMFYASESGKVIVTFALMYDFLAFVPQFIFGYFFDKHTKIRWDYIGVACLGISVFLANFTQWKWLILIFVTMGNAILHEVGAVVTTRVSQGKLSHSAIFVAGGSFGVIMGKHLGVSKVSILVELISVLLILIIIIARANILYDENAKTPLFDIVKHPEKKNLIVATAFCVVTVRSFIGYTIPISWKKEMWQAYVLFFVMGLGKGLGGILSDKFGAKKVGVLSTILCIPFLLIGDNNMLISVLGVFMFSMTMAITLGMLLSVLRDTPGIAFGVTTVGLFTGMLLIFFIPISRTTSMIFVTSLSLLCSFALYKTLK